MASDIKHWHLNATVYKDRVEEIHYISDPARNVRRKQQRQIWAVEQFLGRGGFGEVSLQRNNEAGNARAVKRIAGAGAAMKHNDFEKELRAMLEFSKPKYKEAAVFVEFFGWFKDGSDVFLAMEYIPLGDLEKYVVAQSGKIPEVEARDIAEQIISGLEIMHAESFAHRDLKPQNVLVVHGSPEWWVKLADFGLSKRLTDATGYHTRAGTQAYMAPEVQNLIESGVAGSDYTNAVDMWAVGCITYRLVTGVVPFPPGRTLIKYCEDRSLFPYDALFDSSIKSTCSKFIRHLLVAQPQERPSATQALQHEWIGVSTNIERRPSFRQQAQKAQQQQAFQPSQSAITEVDYNTVSHEGLKSYQAQSSDTYSSPWINASNANLSFASGSTTITPEALPPNPDAAASVADSRLGKVELLHPVSSLPSISSPTGSTRGPPGPPPPLPDGWAAEWSEHFQKWWYFSKHASEPEAPRWIIPTEPVGHSEEDGATDEGTPEADEEEEEGEEYDIDPEVRRKEELRARMAKMSGGMGMHRMFGPSGGMPMLGPAALKKKKSTPIEKRLVEEEMTSPRAPPVPMIPLPGLSQVRSPQVGWVPGKAGTDSKIFALIIPSEVYPDGRLPLWAHYSDKTDENYIVERLNHVLKLPPLSDGKVVMSWVPEEGGEVISQRFAVWPDWKGLSDVVFTTRVEEKGSEPVPKLLFPDGQFRGPHQNIREPPAPADFEDGFDLNQPADDNIVEEQFLAVMTRQGWSEEYQRSPVHTVGDKWLMVVQDRLNEQERKTGARDPEHEILPNTEKMEIAPAPKAGVRHGSDGKPYSFNALREDMPSNMPKVPKYPVRHILPLHTPIEPRPPRPPRPSERAVGIYTFDSDEPGDLPFTKGDVIEILSLANEHWYKGRLDTREGIIPANYVEVLPVPIVAELWPAKISKVRALFDYSPPSSSSFGLSFKKYEIIRLIRPHDTSSELFIGRITLGRTGIFPLKYVATESQYQELVRRFAL